MGLCEGDLMRHDMGSVPGCEGPVKDGTAEASLPEPARAAGEGLGDGAGSVHDGIGCRGYAGRGGPREIPSEPLVLFPIIL